MTTWSQIEAECEATGYRERLVEVFRKYEGQPTDENDEQGRTVKVTAQSFARHMGIPETTFRGWIKSATRAVLPEHREQMDAAKARKATQQITQRPSEERKELIKELARSLPDEDREDIAFDITSEASRERQQNYARQAKANEAAEKPFTLETVNHVHAARKQLEILMQEISRHGLNAEAKEVVSAEITAIRSILTNIEAAMQTPNMDKELEDILKAGS